MCVAQICLRDMFLCALFLFPLMCSGLSSVASCPETTCSFWHLNETSPCFAQEALDARPEDAGRWREDRGQLRGDAGDRSSESGASELRSTEAREVYEVRGKRPVELVAKRKCREETCFKSSRVWCNMKNQLKRFAKSTSEVGYAVDSAFATMHQQNDDPSGTKRQKPEISRSRRRTRPPARVTKQNGGVSGGKTWPLACVHTISYIL